MTKHRVELSLNSLINLSVYLQVISFFPKLPEISDNRFYYAIQRLWLKNKTLNWSPRSIVSTSFVNCSEHCHGVLQDTQRALSKPALCRIPAQALVPIQRMKGQTILRQDQTNRRSTCLQILIQAQSRACPNLRDKYLTILSIIRTEISRNFLLPPKMIRLPASSRINASKIAPTI